MSPKINKNMPMHGSAHHSKLLPRNPSLIDLPGLGGAIDSIPILGTLLSPIVGGGPATTTVNPPPSSVVLPPQPGPTGGNGNGNGSGNGNGGSGNGNGGNGNGNNGSGNGNGNGSDNGGGSTTPGNPSGGGPSNSGGNMPNHGNGSSPASGGSSNSGGSPGNGNNSAAAPVESSSSLLPSNNSGPKPSASSNASPNIGSGSHSAGLSGGPNSSGTPIGSALQAAGTNPLGSNFGNNRPPDGSSSLQGGDDQSSPPTPVITVINGKSTTIIPSTNPTHRAPGSDPSSTGPGSSPIDRSSSKGHSLATGALVAIISLSVLAAITLCLCLFIRRRRRANRLVSHAWWFHTSEHTPAIRTSHPDTASIRSSFGTSFERPFTSQGNIPPLPTSNLITPDLPPMAEARHAPLSARGGHYSSLHEPPIPSPPLPSSTFGRVSNETSRYRDSIGSASGENDAQYLIVPSNTGPGVGELSPMSVRPFTPSESWSFPKPPGSSSSLKTTEGNAPTGKTRTIWLHPPPAPKSAGINSLLSFTPAKKAAASAVVSPWLDNISPTFTPKDTTTFTESEDPFAEPVNPFVDPAPSPRMVPPEDGPFGGAPRTSGAFAEIETVHRPFLPTLSDELGVEPGDRVRVVRAFDDGWAAVEKLKDDGETSGDHGLIPVECIQLPVGESANIPSLIASKRVSSYSTSGFAL